MTLCTTAVLILLVVQSSRKIFLCNFDDSTAAVFAIYLPVALCACLILSQSMCEVHYVQYNTECTVQDPVINPNPGTDYAND